MSIIYEGIIDFGAQIYADIIDKPLAAVSSKVVSISGMN